MATVLDRSESAILSRAIDCLEEGLTPDLAKHMLNLQLSEADKHAAKQLAELAKSGTLSEEQQIELKNYRRAGRILELLKSKARLALKTTIPASS